MPKALAIAPFFSPPEPRHLAIQNDLAGALAGASGLLCVVLRSEHEYVHSEDTAFSARFKFLEVFQRVKGERLLAEVRKECCEVQ